MNELRPYQTKAISELQAAIRSGMWRLLLALPTGAGKTTIAAEIIRLAVANGKTCLFIVHRVELVTQAVERFKSFGIHSDIMWGSNHTSGAPVTVATVQTLARRKLPKKDIVFIDETHHATSATYQNILNAYHDAYIIGLTATPYRLDGKPLGTLYETLVEPVSNRELIGQNFLATPRYFCAKDQLETAGVRKVGGDFSSKGMFMVANRPTLYGGVVANYQRFIGEDNRAIVFCVNKEHSQKTCAAFQNAGIPARHIDCDTPPPVRCATLEDFRRGDIKIMCNVQILTEGYDLPLVAGVILNKATASKGLFSQMVGRCLRPAEGKKAAIIIDHGGNVVRHGMIEDHEQFDINEDKQPRGDGDAPIKICPKCDCMLHTRLMACDNCGHIFIEKKKVEKHSEFSELVAVDFGQNAAVPVKQKPYRLMTEAELEAVRRERGYKPGWKFYVQGRHNKKRKAG